MIDLSGAAGFLPLILAGLGVGFLVGLTGVGGGALMTPLRISSFGVTPQIAVGTDLLYASITKTAGSSRHHVSDHVEWPIVFRLAAGSIVATSILASIWKPKARFVAGGIGAGLTFAALSNTCAMGAALGCLPFNRPRAPRA